MILSSSIERSGRLKKAFSLPQTKADKSGQNSIFICPADDSGPNILHAMGVRMYSVQGRTVYIVAMSGYCQNLSSEAGG